MKKIGLTKTGKASPKSNQHLIVIIFSIMVIIIMCSSVMYGLCETDNKNQSKTNGIVCHPGLYARYYSVTDNYTKPTYNDITYKAWQVDPNIDFNWGAGEPTDTYVGSDHFFVQWEGYLKIEEKNSFLFYVDHDDGVRIWFDNNIIIDNWTSTVARNYSIMNNVAAGYHPLKIEFFENTGNAKIVLSWIKMSEWDINISVEDLPANPIPPNVFRQNGHIYWYQNSETVEEDYETTETIDKHTIITHVVGNATYYNTTHYSNTPMDNVPHTTTVHSSTCLKTWTAPGVPVNQKTWLFFTFYLSTNISNNNQPRPDNLTIFLGDMNMNMWFNGYKYNTSEYLSMYGSEEDGWIPSLHAEPYSSETITFNIEEKRKNYEFTLIGYNSMDHSCAYAYYGTLAELFNLNIDDADTVTATQIMATSASQSSLTSYSSQPVTMLTWYSNNTLYPDNMWDLGKYSSVLNAYRAFLKIYIPPSAAKQYGLTINISHPSPNKEMYLNVKRNSFASYTAAGYNTVNSNLSASVNEIDYAGWYYMVFDAAIQKNMINESFIITTNLDSDNPYLLSLNSYSGLIPYFSETYMCNLTQTGDTYHVLNHTVLTEKYCVWNNQIYNGWIEYQRTTVEVTRDITVHTAKYQSKYDICMNFMEQLSYPHELVEKSMPGNDDIFMFFYDGSTPDTNFSNSINILKNYNCGVPLGPFPPNGKTVLHSDQGYMVNVWVDLLVSPTINGRYNWVYSNTSSYWGTDKIIHLVYYDKILPFGMGNNDDQYKEYPDNTFSVTQDGYTDIYDRETNTLLHHSSITGGFGGTSASAGWLAFVMRDYPNVSDIQIVYNTTVQFSFSVKHPGETSYTVANNSPDSINISVSKNYTIYRGENNDNVRLILKHDVDHTKSYQPALEKLKISIPEEGLIEHGLRADYYNYHSSNYSENPVDDTIFDNPVIASRIESNINTTWSPGSLPGNVTSDYFAVRWEGYLKTPVVTYGFVHIYTDNDDGCRVWVDNKLIIDDWHPHDTTQNIGSIRNAHAGYYHIRVEYFEKTGNADIVLSLGFPQSDPNLGPYMIKKTVIPPEYLYHSQHYENGIHGIASYVPAYPYLGFIYNVETPLSVKTYNMSSILSRFYNDTSNNITHIIIGNQTYFGYWDPPLNTVAVDITDNPKYSIYPGNPTGNKTYLPYVMYQNMTSYSGSEIYSPTSFSFYTLTLRRTHPPYPIYQYGLYGVSDTIVQDMMQDQTTTMNIAGTDYDIVRTPEQRNLVVPTLITPLEQTFNIQTLFYGNADFNTSTITMVGLTNTWTPTLCRIDMNTQNNWTTEEINTTWAGNQMLAVTPYHTYIQISTDKNTYKENEKIILNIHLHIGPDQTTPGMIDGQTLNNGRTVTVTVPYYTITTESDGSIKYSFDCMKTLQYTTDSNGDIFIDDEHIRASTRGAQVTATVCMGMEDDELYISSISETHYVHVTPEWMDALMYVAIFCFIAFIAWGICRYYSKWYHGERENMGGGT